MGSGWRGDQSDARHRVCFDANLAASSIGYYVRFRGARWVLVLIRIAQGPTWLPSLPTLVTRVPSLDMEVRSGIDFMTSSPVLPLAAVRVRFYIPDAKKGSELSRSPLICLVGFGCGGRI